MKRILKKLLVVLLIFLTINTCVLSNVAQANVIEDAIEGIASAIIGIFAYPIQLFLALAGSAINLVTGGVASVDNENSNILATLTPFDILFNQVEDTGKGKQPVDIVNVNFFDDDIKDDSIIGTIRESVAVWYYVLRMIACVILLVILVYVGIRMAITTIASDKAMYTKMLTDWACSLALIFLLQYIMIFVFNVNDALVKAMYAVSETPGTNGGLSVSEAFDKIFVRSFKFGTDGIGASAVYFILVIQTIGLLISYINRMLKIAFLMIISPLITLTYSIDKMGDGKAQALGTWLKEFIYTVLMQPFHCIIYLVMVSTSLNLLVEADDSNNLGFAVLAILCVRFVQDAEKIVRKIFHFEDDNSGTSVAAGMAISGMALAQSKNIGKTLKSGYKSARNLGTNTKNLIKHAGTDAMVIGAMMRGKNKKTDENGNVQTMSYAELKDEIQAEKVQKQADKLGKKVYGRIAGDSAYSNLKSTAKREELVGEDKKRYDELKNSGMNHSLAMATLRKEKLQKEKNKKDERDNTFVHRARGTVNKVKALKQLDTFKDLQGMKSAWLSAGTAAAVGIGMYGSGQNLMQSGMAAATAYGTMREFTSNTTKTLVNDAVQSVAALSGDTAEEKENKLRLLAQDDGQQFEENSDRIKELLKNIEEQLKKLGMDDKTASKFKNTIRNDLKVNALKGNPSTVSDIVKKNIASYNNTSEGHKKPINMAKDFSALNNAALLTSDFENEKIVYNSLQKIMQDGTSAETAISDVMGQYKAYSSSEISPVDKEFSNNRIGDDDDIERVEMEKEAEEHNNEVDKIEQIINNDKDKDIEKEVDRIVKEFESKADMENLTDDLAKDIMADARIDILADVEKYIREAIDASKNGKVKELTDELNSQIKELERERTKLESKKNKMLSRGTERQIVETQVALAENTYKTQYMKSAIAYMNPQSNGNGGN